MLGMVLPMVLPMQLLGMMVIVHHDHGGSIARVTYNCRRIAVVRLMLLSHNSCHFTGGRWCAAFVARFVPLEATRGQMRVVDVAGVLRCLTVAGEHGLVNRLARVLGAGRTSIRICSGCVILYNILAGELGTHLLFLVFLFL